MGSSTLACIATLCFMMFSCGSNRRNAAKPSPVDTAGQSSAKTDTIPTPPPPVPGPAPGTMQVKAQIVALHPDKKQRGGTMELKILQIVGVGAATPGVVKNDTLAVKTSTLPDSLQKGTEISGTLHHRKVLANFKDSASAEWTFVSMNKKSNSIKDQQK